MSTGFLRLLLGSVLCCAVFAPAASARTDAAEASAGGSCTGALRMLAASGGANGLQTFDDFIEDTAGPDICGENAVTNDNEGTITFGLHIHNRTAWAANEHYGVLLDSDNDPATGIEGADHLVRISPEGAELAKWDGTTFATQTALPPAEWAPGYGPVFQLKAADLGDAKSFGFFFYSSDGTNVDYAPNAGVWSYQLTPLLLGARAVTHDRARAGRSFTARMTVVRSDFDSALTEGAITCAARLGGKPLAGRGRFAGSRVTCTWRLPKNARRKRLTGTVAVSFQGVEAKRAFAATVR